MLLARWGYLVARRRWTVLTLTLLIAAVTMVLGPSVISRLSTGGFEDPNSESARMQERVAATVGRPATDAVLLYSGADAGLAVTDPAFEQAVTSSLEALPDDVVLTTITWWNSGRPDGLISADGSQTYALLELKGTSTDERMTSFLDVEDRIRDVGAGLTVQAGGQAPLNAQITNQVTEDLARAEALSTPILLILLVLVFGSLIAAGLPLMIGLLTVTGSFAALRVLTEFTEVSVFAINIITLLGLGLAIDYSLFMVSRFREELAAGRAVPEALSTTLATAGRTVLFSGVTVAVSLTSLMLFPQAFLRSMGFGGVAAVVVAMLTSLTLLPAMLAILGTRVNALRLRLPQRLVPGARRRRAAAGTAPVGPRGWEWFALAVMRRPVVFGLAAVTGLLFLALPALSVNFGGIDARALPAGSEGRLVDETLRRDFPGTDAFPVQVLVDGGGAAAAEQVTADLKTLDGVTGVRPAGGAPAAGAPATASTLLLVDHDGGAMDAATLDLVRAARALPDPAGSTVLVGGSSAEQVDLRAGIGDRVPWMAAFMVVTTFVLLFLAFGSFVLPIKAILTNLLSLAASFGIVTWIFGQGHLSGLLNFTPTGTVETTQPILMLAIVFGLSMDYEVFLLSRIKEQWDRTGDATAAVAGGLQRTGRIITSAALLLVVVIGAFSTSGIAFIKMLGLGMALAIVIDATVVRAVLVPATMRLLGRSAWWAPAPLARWHARHGFHETDELVPAPQPGRRADLTAVESDAELAPSAR